MSYPDVEKHDGCIGITRGYHEICNGYGSYCRRIFLDYEINEEILRKIRYMKVGYELREGLEINTGRCWNCKKFYIEISKNSYHISKDQDYVGSINEFVKEIEKYLKKEGLNPK
jgi:hypothetical protein